MDLFRAGSAGTSDAACPLPLAARMRPRTLDEIVGQDHILAPGKLLRRAIEADRLSSVILFGPPGSGKTSLGSVIASVTRRPFERASGVTANVSVLREFLQKSRWRLEREGKGTILFLDEIHRLSKSQQDVLLPEVEEGAVILIGATTHNPLFFVNSPLHSRSLIFELRPLSEESILQLLQRALSDPRGLAHLKIRTDEDSLRHLASRSEGDARRALNALEIAALSTPAGVDGCVRLTLSVMEESIQKKAVLYDRDEDGHYDTISAFIKSVRGSDPHAAIYWLAKMLEAGEDPRFIARRLVILASEDIGNADPRGLTIAMSAMDAVECIGMPEARIILAQATTYLATAPKSNAAYRAIEDALNDVRTGRVFEVPPSLRSVRVPTAGEANGALSTPYVYPHDHPGHFVVQDYLPAFRHYYAPDGQGYEDSILKRMKQWEAKRAEGSRSRPHGPPSEP